MVFLVLISISFLGIIISEFSFKYEKFKPIFHKEEAEARKNLKLSLIGLASFVFVLFLLIIFQWNFLSIYWEVILIFTILSIHLGIILFLMVLWFFHYLTYEQIKRFVRFGGNFSLIVIHVLLLIVLFKLFNNSVSNTSLANIENINCIIQSDAFPEDSHKILYYNDKYIFVEEIFEKEKRIRVLPFDSFFKECQ